MTTKEEYEARKAREQSRRQRNLEKRESAAAEAALAQKPFWRHPDKIVRYTGSLQLYTLALFVATLALFGASVGTAIILYNTDAKIGSQAESTRALAQAALKQAEAAEKQVIALQRQLDEMKNTTSVMRLEQRAWIALRGFAEVPPNFSAQSNNYTEATLGIENMGREPAIKVAEEIYSVAFPIADWNTPAAMIRIIQAAIGGHTCKDVPVNSNGRVIWPGAKVGRVVGVSEEDVIKINGRSHYAMLAGCIVYETLRERHETEVCVILEPVIQGGGWRSVDCIVHNQAN